MANIWAIGSASDGDTFERPGTKDVIYNKMLCLPDECFLPKTNIKCPYVITADDTFPLGYHLMNPHEGRTQSVYLIANSHLQEEQVRILLGFRQQDGAFLNAP